MQIYYSTNTKLSTYSKSVLTGKWEFPDFSAECPICGKKDCAVRIGFYWRWGFDFKEMKKIYTPIARYLCRREDNYKSNLKSSHKTFSLLPSQLIPYKLYDVDSLIFMANLRYIKKNSLLDIADEFSAISESLLISVSPATIWKYLLIFTIAHTKMISLLKLNYDIYRQSVDHIINFTGGPVAYVEYIYQKYALFLFGTPSHLR